MNATLIILNGALLVLVVAAWLSPDLMERIAQYLRARAIALRVSRDAYVEHFEYHMGRDSSRKCRSILSKAGPTAGALLILVAVAALVAMPQ